MITHGLFDPEHACFRVWGESTDPARPRGRRPKVALHPFAASAQQLSDWLAARVPHLQPPSEPLNLWLPGTDLSPQPSPELRSVGFDADAAAPPAALFRWQVASLTLSPGQAVDLLLALRRAHVGQSLAFWRAAALEALALVMRQQVIPALEADAFRHYAFWQPLPEQPERLRELAIQMPPLCRAASDSPDAAPSPHRLLDGFVRMVVDAVIREAAAGRAAPARRTPAAAWYAALTGSNRQLNLPTAEADALVKAWQTWAGQNTAAGNDAFRIAFRLNAPEPADQPGAHQPWRLDYLLQATDDPSLIVQAAQIWRSKADAYLLQRFDQPQERLLRGLAFAGRLFAPILESLKGPAPASTAFDTALAYTFLQDAAPLLQASGFRVLLPRWWGGKKARLTARAKVSGGKQSSKAHLTLDTLVSYRYELMLGSQALDRDEFARLAALKQPLVQLRGQWVLLDPDQVEAGIRFFDQMNGQVRLDAALRLGLDDAESVHGIPLQDVRADGWLKTLMETLKDPEKISTLTVPEALHAHLRPYQQRGYSWMAFLRRYGLGACLADDMGLGKTVTTIALLLHVRHNEPAAKPAIVVCPTSVVGNWRREIQRFAPELVTYTHLGTERSSGEAFASHLTGVDVVITSYPLLARDRETLAGVAWSSVILDEAQNIKNTSTKQAQAARALHGDHRIALTGTPVENRLTELWSIFNFLNPGYLGSEQDFRRRFANPIEKLDDTAAAKRLRQLTAPFILRRLKTDKSVISDLPDKIETKVYTPLTAEQATLYEAVVKDVMAQIEQAEADENAMSRRGLVLSLLMQLKQICNHPAQYLKDGSALEGRSGKVARLLEMLDEVYAAGDRALIFTQFAEMGEILRQHLRTAFHDEPLWLHGGTKVKDREDMLRRFQAERGPSIFILSLKAGGVGLNLTRASHVVHFDRWWNPAVENQATDRAFRIGQTRTVQVHKFVCTGTLEEKIDDMIESKKLLAERVVGADESWLTEFDTASLRDLVRLRETEIKD